VSRPSRDTAPGRAYLDLQARARRDGRPTDELFVLYVLERFLYRLSLSDLRDHLVLKGGMLLAAFGDRRPTRDVDLLALSVSNDLAAVVAVVRTVLARGGRRRRRLRARPPHHRDHPGAGHLRRSPYGCPARLHRAQHPLRIDVNVGDPVTPGPVEVEYPSLLGDAFSVVGYPIDTVLAEKIVTMIDRGDATTRERDFADVALLTRHHEIDGSGLADAINATAAHRGSEVRPLREVLMNLGRDRQPDWARFLRRSGLETDLPESYDDTISVLCRFADPVLGGEAQGSRWAPELSAGRPPEDPLCALTLGPGRTASGGGREVLSSA